jgi:tetratricopeptide (TPR) repeat protein
MNNNVGTLVDSAVTSAGAGNWQQAEALWNEVLKIEPAHSQALCSLGIHALQRGDTSAALEYLETSRAATPRDLLTLMTIAAAHRQRKDAKGEIEAIDSALETDPHFIPALLAKANWMELHGTPVAAAALYKAALQISPPEREWPADFRERLNYARNFVNRCSSGLFQHLSSTLESDLQKLPPGLAPR